MLLITFMYSCILSQPYSPVESMSIDIINDKEAKLRLTEDVDEDDDWDDDEEYGDEWDYDDWGGCTKGKIARESLCIIMVNRYRDWLPVIHLPNVLMLQI